ncbi:MAG TPA: OmpP1/FadL family transporter [Syntrophorhabdales bacterium]|nr:OmpP1/FadL family transporter [Syntrophorhabdales bacterium]
MRAWSIVPLAILSMLLSPFSLFANGFDIYEQSAKAVGLGGAFIAQADDPSAIFFNPAGIVQLEGTQLSVGGCAIRPTMKFRSYGNPAMGTAPGETWTIKDHVWVIPNAYLTRRINDNVSAGLGVFSHFGLGVEWPGNFEGRFSPGSIESVLTTVSVSPVISVKASERFSIGFGPYAQYLNVDLRNKAFIGMPAPPLTANRNLAQTAEAELKGNDWGWGVNTGLRVKLTDRIIFGASYISRVNHNITNGTQTVTSSAINQVIFRQNFSSSITLPAKLRTGLAWIKHPWTVEIGAEWTEWSSYRTLRADFTDGTFLDSRKNWHNVWMYRFGVQYTLNKYLDLRAAYLYDESPVPRTTLDPLVPSGDRNVICLGVGTHFGKLTVDVGYNHVWDQNRTWNNPSGNVNLGPFPLTRVTGQFRDAYADLLAVNVTYRF